METAEPQVAFAIGRSFGTAVERNRGRRRLRAAFVDALRDDDGCRDLSGAFLLTGTRGLLTTGYQDLVADVEACIDRVCGDQTQSATAPTVQP